MIEFKFHRTNASCWIRKQSDLQIKLSTEIEELEKSL